MVKIKWSEAHALRTINDSGHLMPLTFRNFPPEIVSILSDESQIAIDSRSRGIGV
jgi:hypothetical protein